MSFSNAITHHWISSRNVGTEFYMHWKPLFKTQHVNENGWKRTILNGGKIRFRCNNRADFWINLVPFSIKRSNHQQDHKTSSFDFFRNGCNKPGCMNDSLQIPYMKEVAVGCRCWGDFSIKCIGLQPPHSKETLILVVQAKLKAISIWIVNCFMPISWITALHYRCDEQVSTEFD